MIKNYFKKRSLKKAIKKSSFNCMSMESASKEEWEYFGFADKYEIERQKLDTLRKQINSL